MSQLKTEVEANFQKFSLSYQQSAQATSLALQAHQDTYYAESYQRIVTLQAWRAELLERTISKDSLLFFLEAQNDALTSHVHARSGAWRSALQSLRSCIENTLFSLYYKDHPAELRLWLEGKHRLAYSEMADYFEKHPSLLKIKREMAGRDLLDEQYSTLSRAVHASAASFRMSVEGVGPQLWSAEVARLGKWSSNEGAVLVGINRLLMALFREELQKTRLPNLRKAISLIFPLKHHGKIKSALGVSLYS